MSSPSGGTEIGLCLSCFSMRSHYLGLIVAALAPSVTIGDSTDLGVMMSHAMRIANVTTFAHNTRRGRGPTPPECFEGHAACPGMAAAVARAEESDRLRESDNQSLQHWIGELRRVAAAMGLDGTATVDDLCEWACARRGCPDGEQ